MRISDWSSDVCSSDLMKFKYLAPAIALAAGVASPASAAFFIEGIGSTSAIAPNNDFAGELDANYSYTLQTSDFTGLSLLSPARITFYALASASGYEERFSPYGLNGVAPTLTFQAHRQN